MHDPVHTPGALKVLIIGEKAPRFQWDGTGVGSQRGDASISVIQQVEDGRHAAEACGWFHRARLIGLRVIVLVIVVAVIVFLSQCAANVGCAAQLALVLRLFAHDLAV